MLLNQFAVDKKIQAGFFLGKFVTVQYLHSYDAKIHENRLRRWDFRTHESCSYGLRGSAPTCSEQLQIFKETAFFISRMR